MKAELSKEDQEILDKLIEWDSTIQFDSPDYQEALIKGYNNGYNSGL